MFFDRPSLQDGFHAAKTANYTLNSNETFKTNANQKTDDKQRGELNGKHNRLCVSFRDMICFLKGLLCRMGRLEPNQK